MSAGHCTNCGTPHAATDNFCGVCGNRLRAGAADAPPPPPAAPVGATQTTGDGYSEGARILAIVALIFIPLVTLIAALVLRSEERIESRREFLKNIAIGSAAWMFTGWGLAFLLFVSAASSGPSNPNGGF